MVYKKNMQKFLWLVLGVLILLGLVFFFWIGGFSEKGYTAVYLKTGDLYFGKVVRFPTFGLKGIVSIQPTQNTQTPLAATRFTNLFWGPEDFMQINRSEVVWMVKLNKEGQLAKVLKDNPDLISASPAPQDNLGAVSDMPGADAAPEKQEKK